MQLGRGRALLLVLVAVVCAAAAFAGLGAVADFGKVADALRRADLTWLLLVPVGLALNYGGFVSAWRTVARVRDGVRIGWWTAARVVALRSGATLVFGGGALAVDAWALREAGARTHDVVRRVLALDLARFASLGVIAGITAVLVLLVGPSTPAALELGWGAGLVVVVAVGFAPAPRAPGGTSLVRRFAADAVAAVALARTLLRHPARRPGTAIGLPVCWLGNVVLVYAATRALGIELAPGQLLLAYATAQLLLVIPLPIGASGGFEATLASMLTLFGAPLAAALPAAFLYRVCGFWVPAAISFGFASSLRGIASDLARSRAQQVVPVARHDGEVAHPFADREHAVRNGAR